MLISQVYFIRWIPDNSLRERRKPNFPNLYGSMISVILPVVLEDSRGLPYDFIYTVYRGLPYIGVIGYDSS